MTSGWCIGTLASGDYPSRTVTLRLPANNKQCSQLTPVNVTEGGRDC